MIAPSSLWSSSLAAATAGPQTTPRGDRSHRIHAVSDVLASLEAGLLIVAYMACSIGIVYLNAWILRDWPYAATLTTLQMTFCSVAAHMCVWILKMADPWSVGMTPRLYLTLCVPLSVLYMVYLYGSNDVYDYLPVGYIQLLKPAQAIFVYALLAAAGKEAVAVAPVLNLAVILAAVVVASVSQSEIDGWSTVGFVLMMVSNLAYACYLVGQQLLLNTRLGAAQKTTTASRRPGGDLVGGPGHKTPATAPAPQPKKLDAITTLFFLGPSTAACLALLALADEWRRPTFSFDGIPAWILLGDCFVAFSLNLIQIRIVGRLSALTYMMAGYLKGCITVAISWLFFDEHISALEVQGYVVMLLGQLLWSLRKLRLKTVAAAATASPLLRKGGGKGVGDPSAHHALHHHPHKLVDPNTVVAEPPSRHPQHEPTIRANAAIAAAALVLYLVYSAFDVCALVPCGAPPPGSPP